MAKKRITLPKEFKDLMDEGNIEALKAVYDRCVHKLNLPS